MPTKVRPGSAQSWELGTHSGSSMWEARTNYLSHHSYLPGFALAGSWNCQLSQFSNLATWTSHIGNSIFQSLSQAPTPTVHFNVLGNAIAGVGEGHVCTSHGGQELGLWTSTLHFWLNMIEILPDVVIFYFLFFIFTSTTLNYKH